MMKGEDDNVVTAGAQSVRRALAVLRSLAAGQEQGVRLTDVVSDTGLNRPTAHRILRVLVEECAVEQNPATRRYMIGRELPLLGLARSAKSSLQACAEPRLHQLSQVLGDTVFLTIRNGADSICIQRHIGSFPIKVLSIEVGARRPLGVGVSGLVLLSALPDAEAEDVVRRNERRLRALKIAPYDLLQRAAQVSQCGFAYAPVGVVPGTRALAVPVSTADGATVAGLAAATITERLPEARIDVLLRHMQKCAEEIGRAVRRG